MGVAGDIDQNIAQSAIHQPRRHVIAIFFAVGSDFTQGDFQLVELVVSGFIHTRRLAGWADKHAGKQIAQRRVVVPIGYQAGQQLGTAQKRAVCRCGTAHDEMVTTAGARMAAVGHELFGR